MKRGLFYFVAGIIAGCLILSCQKEIDGTINGGTVIPPADQKPKVGTIWTYYYNWYNTPGGSTQTKVINHKAKSEEMIGGEKWLKIIDMETDTTVFFLNTKMDGLYQYTNSNPYILCKYPAFVNDTYTTFNEGASEFFTVRGVNDTTATNLGNIPLTKYEGVKNNDIVDVIWYNKNAWIVWKFQYKRYRIDPPGSPLYYLYSKMFIDKIVY